MVNISNLGYLVGSILSLVLGPCLMLTQAAISRAYLELHNHETNSTIVFGIYIDSLLYYSPTPRELCSQARYSPRVSLMPAYPAVYRALQCKAWIITRCATILSNSGQRLVGRAGVSRGSELKINN